MLRQITLLVLMFLLIPISTVAQATPPATASQTSAAGSPENDPFYLPPSPLPASDSGTLIRWEAMPAPPGIRAWRILYYSTALGGKAVAVSGAAFAPDQPTPEGGFPLLAMGHNTTGIARMCAPSLEPFQPLPGATEAFYEQQVAGFVDGGFAVVATDYQGLGAVDSVHPFLVGEVAAYNVLDAARAARALPDLDLAPNTILWGHSQGGHAAVWAGQLALTYAPDLHVAGVILGAPAAEPGLVLAAASGQPEPTPLTGYIVSLVYSWTHVYLEVAAAPALTPIALEKIAIVTQECIPVIAAAYSDLPLTAYVEAAVLRQKPWSDLLEKRGRETVDQRAGPGGARYGGPTGSRRHDRDVGPPVVSTRDRCATQALSRGGPWCGHCRGEARHAGVGHRPDGRETGRLDVLIVRDNSKSLLAQPEEPMLGTGGPRRVHGVALNRCPAISNGEPLRRQEPIAAMVALLSCKTLTAAAESKHGPLRRRVGDVEG